jgi:hypothetical protein
MFKIVQTVSAILSFFLAMTLYPQVQKRAQDELDTLLAPGLMPTFEDRPRLPYIEAVTREVMRWHPVAPEGEQSQRSVISASVSLYIYPIIFHYIRISPPCNSRQCLSRILYP